MLQKSRTETRTEEFHGHGFCNVFQVRPLFGLPLIDKTFRFFCSLQLLQLLLSLGDSTFVFDIEDALTTFSEHWLIVCSTNIICGFEFCEFVKFSFFALRADCFKEGCSDAITSISN
jgi:hypothetical protein